MSKIVIALGGNALGNNPDEQQKAIKTAVKNIVDLIKAGHEVVLAHGNGPQVGVINLAFEVGGEKILETAKNLGFGSPSFFGEDFYSKAGNLPSEEELFSKTVLASFAFGQGKLLATPVQLAVLASAAANKGKAVTPKIVLGTYDKNGVFEKTPDYAKNPVMSEKTAELLKNMMINVVEKGSGENAKPEKGGAGGKTASAQTGQFDKEENEIIHAWFVGFYPAKEPRYAIAVFAEGMNSGGEFAAPVFKKICDGIDLLNND